MKIRNMFYKIFNRKQVAYGNWLDDLHNNKSLFVPYTDAPFVRKNDTPKLFAYYLTQFHAIPENDYAHGLGFTEWTNVASCAPQFPGHFQPKIPYDVGFYNLLDIDVMRRQVEIAKAYGIYGFCFYYYWFSGKKVLEKPLYNFLKSDIDFHFHLCWANENWSRLWDGGNKEIILEQKHQEDDTKKFFYDILPFIKDKRYERIDNKPILMIYNPKLFDADACKKFLEDLNALAKENGFDGFWFMASNAFDFENPIEYGFRGIIEFPPHTFWSKLKRLKIRKVSQLVNFNVLSMTEVISKKLWNHNETYPVFRGVFPSWDNSPRKAYSNGFCFNISGQEFEKWLSDVLDWTKVHNPKNQQYVYINAWNEWAEGAILEPTTRYGYAALNSVKKVLEKNE